MTVIRQAVTHIWESRWFKSMYTLQGKPDTHNIYAFRTSLRMPLVRFLWAVPVRGNLSRWSNRVGRILLLLTPPLSLAEWAVGPTPVSLPTTTIEAVGLSQASIGEWATWVYWAYISSMWSVRSILAHGGQPIVLNWHKRGLQPWRYRLSTSNSPHFPTDCPPLSPNGPARSQVNNLNINL
jgi:hypothetical protein